MPIDIKILDVNYLFCYSPLTCNVTFLTTNMVDFSITVSVPNT